MTCAHGMKRRNDRSMPYNNDMDELIDELSTSVQIQTDIHTV